MRARLLGVPEAAKALGVSRQRIRQLIGEGRLPAIRVARAWVIYGGDLEWFAAKGRPTGRPPKT